LKRHPIQTETMALQPDRAAAAIEKPATGQACAIELIASARRRDL
jgi:hypothetical protein